MKNKHSNDVINIRTKRLKFVWIIVVLLTVLIQPNATHIDFDDVETSWLKNIEVHEIPINGNIRNQSTTQLLKITGLATADIEDGVFIKATYSTSTCTGNETDLQIINNSSENSINTDFIISLKNFNFKQNTVAYLCIKSKYDEHFQHMGPKSKFSK